VRGGEAIPEARRPRKDQPFYHLLAANAQGTYVAYVSEQNLVADVSGRPGTTPASPPSLAPSRTGATSWRRG
jgi:heat shock protein HspQ